MEDIHPMEVVVKSESVLPVVAFHFTTFAV
jgi:hypothetical protein